MTTTSTKIIKQAQSWVGKKESDGSFKTIIDIYNAHTPLARGYKMKYTDHWCATFISALFIKCGATDILPIECGCEPMINLCKTKGIWVENENRKPNVGDIVFYDWDDGTNYKTTDNKGWSDHVGIVESVNGNKFTVIEGNISEKVGRRTLEVNARYLRGFAVPKYQKETTTTAPTTNTTTTTYKYKIGDVVKINGVYVSSTAGSKLKPSKTQGTITQVYKGTNNPYLLDNGNIGFVNDACITGKVTTTTAKTIKVNSKVKLKTTATVYQGASKGVKIPSSVKGKTYTVQQINGNIILLKEISSWVLKNECEAQ